MIWLRSFRLEEVAHVSDTSVAFSAIQQLVNTLGDTADGVLYFERIKGMGVDSVSVRLPAGHGLGLARAILAYFQDGDLLLLENALLNAQETLKNSATIGGARLIHFSVKPQEARLIILGLTALHRGVLTRDADHPGLARLESLVSQVELACTVFDLRRSELTSTNIEETHTREGLELCAKIS